MSTDYVFAGAATTPYEVDAPTGPRSAYGRTKLAGELAVRRLLPERSWVVRTAWVYGETGGNFVKTMRPAGRRAGDARRGRRPARLADLVAGPGRRPGRAGRRRPRRPGVYHCTNAGETTWYGLARAVFAEIGADPDRVRPTGTGAFPRPAPRPAYSVLSDAAWRAAGLPGLRPWDRALHAAFAEVGAALRPA